MTEPILQVKNLQKLFLVGSSFANIFQRKKKHIRAVDGVSFNISRGEIYGLIGESGCGKTTTARLILRLINPTSGSIIFENTDITSLGKAKMKSFRRKMQIVFQDPFDSIDDLMKVGSIVKEPLNFHHYDGDKQKRVKEAIESTGLTPAELFIDVYPKELSGGQRQRVSIARALVFNPELLVADEPISMLDASVRVGILDLLIGLRDRLNITILLITHDVSLARYLCDRIGVMYLGKIVEEGPADDIVGSPMHPYTSAMMKVVPRISKKKQELYAPLDDAVPSPIDLPEGCRFAPRCPYAFEKCKEEPSLIYQTPHHRVACWLDPSKIV